MSSGLFSEPLAYMASSAVYRIPVYRNTGIFDTILYRYVLKSSIRYVPYLPYLEVKSVFENSY